MKYYEVYNKLITEKQAKCLLKCKNAPLLRKHNLFFYPGINFENEFERLFDNSDLEYDSDQLNTYDLECAVLDIIRNKNPKACFYAASVLKKSELPTVLFERIILESLDYESQIAYISCLPCDNIQKFADCIADSRIGYYNLALMLNVRRKYDKSKNVRALMNYGSASQAVFMAKFVKNIQINNVRQKVLNSKDARANYLFALYLNNMLDNDLTKTASINKNYIYDYYENYSPKTKAKIITQHLDRILEIADPQFCYKFAYNQIPDSISDNDRSKYYKLAEQKILESDNIHYLTKYALWVPGADREKHLERVKEIGTSNDVEYLEQSMAFGDFFRQVG